MIGRIRTIKPEVLTDEKLWDLEESTGLPLLRAFVGLWMQADREGRFEWRHRPLKAAILPYWSGDFTACLDALAHAGFIVRYEAEGKSLGYVRTFLDHQQINNREQPSRLPAPPTEQPSPDATPDPSGTRGSRVEHASRDATRGERNRTEQNVVARVDDDGPTHSSIKRGPSARKAYGDAVIRAGGTYTGGSGDRDHWRKAESLAASIAERSGSDAQAILDGWAERYVSERKSRRPAWWLERIEAWASEGTPGAGVSDRDDWHPTQGPPKSAHHDYEWNLWIADGCPNDATWKPRVAS